MAEETQDGQKTLVAFVVGLLIGGMLVWAFSGPTVDAPESRKSDNNDKTTDVSNLESSEEILSNSNTDDEVSDSTPVLQVGKGELSVPDQNASMSVKLESATYPVSEGWIGVRDYNNDQLGYILGVVRFSESDGLIPSEITLQRATTPGNTYAVVIFTEDGDFAFNLAGDAQIDTIFDTFVAQ